MAVAVVCGGQGPEGPLLKAMFEDRKRVFVDLLKWNVPVLDGRFEVDQFDDARATYVIITDNGDHLGSARLLPTTKPHLLDTLFGSLCETTPPTGPDVAEITRFCLSSRQPARIRRAVRNSLVSALVGHALATGIRTYTGVAEAAWLQQVLAFGWRCRPLGRPRQLDGGLLGALAIDIGQGTPALLAANGIWTAAGEMAVPVPEAA